MLQYQKNKLINLILQFEVNTHKTLNKTFEQAGRDDKLYNAMQIIDRNILSIKKQINKL
jgi:hypothetical protein